MKTDVSHYGKCFDIEPEYQDDDSTGEDTGNDTWLDDFFPEQQVVAGMFNSAIADLEHYSQPIPAKHKFDSDTISGKPLWEIRAFLTNPDYGELLATLAGLNDNFFSNYKELAMPMLKRAESVNPHLAM